MMYALRPIIAASTDACPRDAKIMYEMRNIHEDEARWREGVRRPRSTRDNDAKMPADVVTEQSPLPEFSTLEIRQEEILSQLAELKKQVSTLRSFLKLSTLETTEEKPQSRNCKETIAENCASQAQEAVNVSLVVNADPLRPPYSIYALQKLWKDTSIRVETYVHSTVVDLVPITFSSSAHSAPNSIKLSLIYKNVEDLETVTHLHSYPIVGEVNLLRYLSRLIDAHSYENKEDVASATDGILDSCYRVRWQTSRGETDKALSALHDRLKQTHWTGKGEPSIADIAAWSTIKQYPSNAKVPRPLHEWYERCERFFLGGTSTS